MYDLPERVTPMMPQLATSGPRPDSPWAAVALGATLQGVAHVLYLGSLLPIFFVAFMMTVAAGPTDDLRGFAIFLMVLAGLAFCANFILSLVAGAVLASADVGARARGIGVALLVCTVAVLLKLSSLGYYMRAIDRGGFMDGPGDGLVGPVGLLLFGLLEVTRLSLVGFYISMAASAGRKHSLASSGHLLGVLSPVIQVALGVFSFFGVMMARSGKFGELTGPGLLAVNGGVTFLLLLFGAMLCFQLRTAANQLAEDRPEDN